ncbi:MotE family protein [Psychrobacillus sp. FSL K6-1267]|uniref:MotE family protein n=1 Tax=Psychrobacillus sp. FSL K6-1267 TaxID=2921543 RepID=UPI0030FB3604
MAKPNNKKKSIQTMDKEPKKVGLGKKILYLFIIPLLFALALLLTFAQITNINVFEKAKELTSLGQEEPIDENKKTSRLEERVVSLQAEIQQKEVQIDKLQAEVDGSEKSQESLLLEQESLLQQIEELKRQNEQSKRDYAEVVSTFEKMSAKTAAPVITNMSDAEALRILASLKPDTVAKIYEKMSPKDAAKYTELMTKQ